jgi:hypothetical protein
MVVKGNGGKEIPEKELVSLNNIYLMKFEHTIIQIYIYLQCSMGFRNKLSNLCKSISLIHCRQRAPVGIDLSSSGTSQLGIFDIQTTTKSKHYDHIVLLYLESRRCRYRSIIFVCFYLYVSVVNLIDY